ncbi:MAG: hypothetical protein HY553_03225 [Elusimicrobia bacterium]|nr:hypothetical protein [Elusimicrobiota bacterium]
MRWLAVCLLTAPGRAAEFAPVPVPVAVAEVRIAPMAGAVPAPPAALARLAPLPLSLPVAMPLAPVARPTLLGRLRNWVAGVQPTARPASVEHESVFGSLQELHGLLSAGDYQAGLDHLERYYTGKRARDWYDANPEFDHYRSQALAYYRHAERALMAELDRGIARAKDPALVEAAKAGPSAGHDYRETELQEKDSPWCAYHALLNAAKASVGLARPIETRQLVAYAQRLLDRDAIPFKGEGGVPRAEAALGIPLRVRAAGGLNGESVLELARALGGSARASALPEREDELRASLAAGEEWLLGLRFFHARYPVAERERRALGHDYEPLAHQAYLLGAFEHEGARYYMLQDSGVGLTTFYTFAELRALTKKAEVVRFPAPLRI